MPLSLRVTFNALARRSESGMSRSLTRLQDAQQQLSSGLRVTRPSDDPLAASKLVRLKAAMNDIGQYQRNSDEAKAMLSLSDSALSSTGELVREARTLIVQAASDGVSSDSAREALRQKLSHIKTQIIGVANTTLNGRSIFSGQKVDTRAFDPTDPTNTYKGDLNTLSVTVGEGEHIEMNVPGKDIFETLLSDLDTLQNDVIGGNKYTLSQQSLPKMDQALSAILNTRGEIGARVNRIESTRGRLDAVHQEIETIASETEEADITQVIVQMQAAQNAYQASLIGTSKAFQQSLMDFLR